MKTKQILISFLIIIASFNCYSQHLVKTIDDAYKIKENEEQFLNKPLKVLLKEIKPPIKRVTASPSNNFQSSDGFRVYGNN